MLHGLLLGNLASWYFTSAPALSETHAVTLYDLRGHGRSEKTLTGYDLDTMVADLAGVVEPWGEQTVSLVGHSFGALVALEYALRHPERVERLVLVEAPARAANVSEMSGFLQSGPEEWLEAIPSSLREDVLLNSRQGRRFLSNLEFLVQQSSLLTDLSHHTEFDRTRLSTLSVPTRCIYGRDSSCRPAGEQLNQLLPTSELRMVSGGHFLPTESPEALTQAIVEFFHA